MLFLACTAVGYFIPTDAKLILMALAAVALIVSLIVALVKHYSASSRYAFLCSIICIFMVLLACVSSYIHFDLNLKEKEEMSGQVYTVGASVLSVRSENNFASSYYIEVQEINGNTNSHKALLKCEYSAALKPGDRITVKAVASLPESSEGRFDEKTSLHSDNIFIIYTSEAEDALDVVEYASGDEFPLENIKNKLSTLLTTSIKGEQGRLSSALLLGNKELLSDSTIRDFRRAGASHILALSGLHMSIIMGFGMFILKRITKKRWLIATILSILSVFYLALTGFSLSASRAVIMLLIVYLSMLISGIPDPLTSLSIAGTIILLISPGAVADAGFWMSFSATLGILVFIPPLNDILAEKTAKKEGKLKRLAFKCLYSPVTAVATGLAAILPLIAVSCVFIKEISFMSVISSVILSIPTAAVILLSLLLLPLNALPHVSGILINSIRTMANVMLDYCERVSDIENVVLSLNYPFAPFIAITLVISLIVTLAIKGRSILHALVPVVACLLVFAGLIGIYEFQNKDKLKVSYTNASSNSDMIVLSNERDAFICDLSNGSSSSYQLALDEVYESRATEIKVIMLTRYTNQHVGTLLGIFEKNKVRELWLPYPEGYDDYSKMERLTEYANKKGVEVFVYNYGDSLHAFDHITIKHIHDYIDRSVVPVSVVGITTSRDQLTYCSPAFNETDIVEEIEFYFSKSKHIIFGNRGPKTKTEYTIQAADKVRTVAFADEMRAGYFIAPEHSFASYYIVPNEIEYYLDE